tara:strand:- start:179 stop:661 length:483 start_codon:yes stop_codon:yes gene_type:complete
MNLNLIPNKEEKKERITKLINFIEKISINFTDNKSVIGYIIFIIHYILIALIFAYTIFNKITVVSYIILFSIVVCSSLVNLYYGSGCTLVRLERHFFNNKEWFGPTTIFYKIFNISTTIENKHISERLSIIFWLCFIIFLSYKLYLTYKKKSNTNEIEIK